MGRRVLRKLHFASAAVAVAFLAVCGSLARGGVVGGGERGSCRCVPDQWEGVLSSVEREFDMKDEKTETLENSIRVHYDYVNRRCAMTDLGTGKRALADYHLGYKYIVNEDGCYQIRTDEVMHRMCLPEEAEFLGRYILGTNVPVGMWLITTPHNQTTRTTVLQENCVPISEEIYMSKGGYASLTNSVYLDVSTGIKDNAVFHAPPNCVHVENDDGEEEEGTSQVQHQDKKRSFSYSEAIRKNLV